MKHERSIGQIIEEAASYHARIASGDVGAEDWAGLEEWLGRSPEHREVFASMCEMSDALGTLGAKDGSPDAEEVPPTLDRLLNEQQMVQTPMMRATRTGSWMQRRYLAMAAALLLAVLVPALFFHGGPGQTEARVYQTAIGERQSVVLEDGSTVTLDADSRIAVTWFEDKRNLAVRQGNVFLDVEPDPDRPFRVAAGAHVITVVGTSFGVNLRSTPVRLTVHTGMVEVSADSAADAGSLGAPVRVGQGEALLFEKNAVPVALDQETLLNSVAWRDGWVHVEGSSLADLVRQLEPYSERPIVLTSQRVAGLRVGGSFNVDKLDSVLAALESLLPVRVRREGNQILIDHVDDAVSG